MITFIDSHAHLNDEAFNEDREQIINSCFGAGVKQIIEIACETNEWQPAVELCEKYKGQIYAAASIHPINAEQFNEESFEISADIVCEKDSHKSIIVGRRGDMIKEIGIKSRRDIENLVGHKINLKLFVRVEKDWRNKGYVN